MANVLKTEKRVAVVKALVEGNSIRGTVRLTGVAKNTVVKLLCDLGAACSAYQDEILRDLPCTKVQCDEIWSFVYAKQKNVPEEHADEFGYGDVWTWTAICADTKVVPCWLVGDRTFEDARDFVHDLSTRLRNRIQLTTDGHRAYLNAVEEVFGADIDYAQLHKIYKKETKPADTRYSPAKCIGIDKRRIIGDPDWKHISTSYVERQNLSVRMSMRRFTRLTNAFSRKVENLAAAVSLHCMHYNFARPHKTLSKPYPKTPAMAAGVADHVWTAEEIVGLLDR
ncbi:MAG: IS1 family transposase [Actinomycetota bacterium]